MIKESIAVFFTGYLYTSLFILLFVPLLVFGHRIRVSLSTRLKISKLLLLGSILFPMVFVFGHYSDINLSDRLPLLIGQDSAATVRVPVNKELGVVVASAKDQAFISDDVTSVVSSTQSLLYLLIDGPICFSIAGLMVFLFRFLYQGYYLNRIESRATVVEVIGDYHVFCSQDIHTPFSNGLLRKRIYLPLILSAGEKEIILAHELNHFQRRHHYWSALEKLLTHLFWFNPLSHYVARTGVLIREMECDADSIEAIDKFEYSRTLIKNVERFKDAKIPCLADQGWFRSSSLSKRLENIMNKTTKERRFIMPLLILSATFFVTMGLLLFSSWGGLNTDEWVENVQHYQSEIRNSDRGILFGQIPQHLIEMLILQEDRSFYSNDGIDVYAIMAAAANNISGKPIRGASTITQQTSRMFMPSEERSLQRKIKEIKYAGVLNRSFTKDEIIELYLNKCYFGFGAYGLNDGARIYFDKSVEQLNIEESAYLIQSIVAPTKYNLKTDPQMASTRKESLLKKMKNHGLL